MSADVEAGLVAEAVALAASLLAEGHEHQSRSQRRRSERLARLLDDPAGVAVAWL